MTDAWANTRFNMSHFLRKLDAANYASSWEA